MTYIFRFWYHLRHPDSLTFIVEKESEKNKIAGYRKSFCTILFLTIALFVARDIWGMYTSRLTELFALGEFDRYIFARYISIIGAAIFSLFYFFFHYYLITYILSLLTDLPFKAIQKVQLYVIAVFSLEKAIEFGIFAIAKFTTLYSPFSTSAIFAQFISDQWLLFFINQFTVATFIAIALQYIFLRKWVEDEHKGLFLKILLLHIIYALIIAYFSTLPLLNWVVRGLS